MGLRGPDCQVIRFIPPPCSPDNGRTIVVRKEVIMRSLGTAAFICSDWEVPIKASVKTADDQSDIRIMHLRNISLQGHCHPHPFGNLNYQVSSLKNYKSWRPLSHSTQCKVTGLHLTPWLRVLLATVKATSVWPDRTGAYTYMLRVYRNWSQ